MVRKNHILYSPYLHGPRKGCRILADFLSGSNRVKICRDIGLPHTSRLSRLTAFSLGAESISAMFEKRLVHVTLMTIPHWLRYARAPTNCLGPPYTSRQGPTRRFDKTRQLYYYTGGTEDYSVLKEYHCRKRESLLTCYVQWCIPFFASFS